MERAVGVWINSSEDAMEDIETYVIKETYNRNNEVVESSNSTTLQTLTIKSWRLQQQVEQIIINLINYGRIKIMSKWNFQI